MRCPHCAFSCEPGNGEDMSFKVYKKALKLNVKLEHETFVLGGGEPTIHPRFKPMLDHALDYKRKFCTQVITNGKHTKVAMYLKDRWSNPRGKNFILRLSTDRFHEKIDPDVLEAYKGLYKDNENDENYTRMSYIGRYLKTMGMKSVPEGEGCIVRGLVVKPDGTIKQCGCDDSPIVGNVYDGILPVHEHISKCCHRSQEFKAQFLSNQNDKIEKTIEIEKEREVLWNSYVDEYNEWVYHWD